MVNFSRTVLSVVVQLSVAGLALGTKYNTRADHIVGSGFYSRFSFQAISDPTHGRVNYVDENTAKSQNLTFSSGNTFITRADFKSTLSSSGPGRNSVRLQSNKAYTNAVMVFNLRHMPVGCGTWPAVWTVGTDWPNNGEIDIVEGVNDQGPNQVTLHTGSGCTMPSSRAMRGNGLSTDCNANDNSNTGCGVKLVDTRSFASIFNDHGGGFFAMERASSGISVWFWSKSGPESAPSDVNDGTGSTSVDTSGWGEPHAFFPSTDCNIDDHFGPQNIVIDLTFCGDWAGQSSVYAASGCPSTCVDFVNNNPSAFKDAYFDFESINIYTP